MLSILLIVMLHLHVLRHRELSLFELESREAPDRLSRLKNRVLIARPHPPLGIDLHGEHQPPLARAEVPIERSSASLKHKPHAHNPIRRSVF